MDEIRSAEITVQTFKEGYDKEVIEKIILVIGATGLLGEPVARQLKRNVFVARLMGRDVKKAAIRFAGGFEL